MAPSLSLQPNDEGPDRVLACCRELRDYLQHAKRLVDDQIRAYPKPIPRCDAQFNYLYEQRTRLADAVEQLNTAIDCGGSPADLGSIVLNILCSPPCSDDEPELALRKQLRDNTDAELGGMLPRVA